MSVISKSNGVCLLLGSVIGLVAGLMTTANDVLNIYERLNPITLNASMSPPILQQATRYDQQVTIENSSDIPIQVHAVIMDVFVNNELESTAYFSHENDKNEEDWKNSIVPANDTKVIIQRNSTPNKREGECGSGVMVFTAKTSKGDVSDEVKFEKKC